MKKLYAWSDKNRRFLIALFFIAYLVIGLCVFKDYGISWDEHGCRTTGVMTLRYVMDKDPALLTYFRRYYGPVFEMALVATERFVLPAGSNARTVFLTRHLMTFLLFFLGVAFFFRLCTHRFKDWRIGLLASFFLILSPRIFADSFYNPKDIPFMSLFIIAMYTMVKFLEQKTIRRALIHAVVCALLIDIRSAGIFAVLFTIIFLVLNYTVNASERTRLKSALPALIIYGLFLGGFTILFWPLLWSAPVKHFFEALKVARTFGERDVLYFGNSIKAKYLPWHYLIVWIFISTPLAYVVGFLGGCGILIKKLICKPLLVYREQKIDIVFLSWFFIPYTVIVLSHQGIYDAWRQMFFIYPALIALALIGITGFVAAVRSNSNGAARSIVSGIIICCITANLLTTLTFMIRYHPHENVYFNALIGPDMKALPYRLDLDYWGLAYKQGFEYLLKNDPEDIIPVSVANWPGVANSYILTPDQQKRIYYVLETVEKTRYFITNHRNEKQPPAFSEYHSIQIQGAPILTIYKLQ